MILRNRSIEVEVESIEVEVESGVYVRRELYDGTITWYRKRGWWHHSEDFGVFLEELDNVNETTRIWLEDMYGPFWDDHRGSFRTKTL